MVATKSRGGKSKKTGVGGRNKAPKVPKKSEHKQNKPWVLYAAARRFAKTHSWAQRNDEVILTEVLRMVNEQRYVAGHESGCKKTGRNNIFMKQLNGLTKAEWDSAKIIAPRKPKINAKSIWAIEHPQKFLNRQAKEQYETTDDDEPSSKRPNPAASTSRSASTSRALLTRPTPAKADDDGLLEAKKVGLQGLVGEAKDLLDTIQEIKIGALIADVPDQERFKPLHEISVRDFNRIMKIPKTTLDALNELIRAANVKAISKAEATAKQLYLDTKRGRLRAEQEEIARRLATLEAGDDTSSESEFDEGEKGYGEPDDNDEASTEDDQDTIVKTGFEPESEQTTSKYEETYPGKFIDTPGVKRSRSVAKK